MRWSGRKFPLGFAKHSHVVLGDWRMVKARNDYHRPFNGWDSMLALSIFLWLNHLVLSTCNRCCPSRWGRHRRGGWPTLSRDIHPRTLTFNNKARFCFIKVLVNLATSWRSVISRGHLGSSDREGSFLAKDQAHWLSLSPEIPLSWQPTLLMLIKDEYDVLLSIVCSL